MLLNKNGYVLVFYRETSETARVQINKTPPAGSCFARK